MQITLAKSAGFCFGVNRAVNMLYDLVDKGVSVDRAATASLMSAQSMPPSMPLSIMAWVSSRHPTPVIPLWS